MIIQFSAVSTYGQSYANQSNNPDIVYELFSNSKYVELS